MVTAIEIAGLVIVWLAVLIMILVVLPNRHRSISISKRPDYITINRAELEIYGKVLTTKDWRGIDLDQRLRHKPPVVVYRPGEHCKECHSVNIQYHEPWCSKNRQKMEVWTSNKHIITRYPDRSDTFNIIEGEGLE